MKRQEADPVAWLKGLADPTRLRIMGLLAVAGGELCVCQIEGALGESQYKISRHLKILKQTGWVSERRDGRWVHYRLTVAADRFQRRLAEALADVPAAFLDMKVLPRELPRLKKKAAQE